MQVQSSEIKQELRGITGDLITLSKMSYELANRVHEADRTDAILPMLMDLSKKIDAAMTAANLALGVMGRV